MTLRREIVRSGNTASVVEYVPVPPVVRRAVSLHPADCACHGCVPFRRMHTTSDTPAQILVVWLADDEPAPAGWRRA